MPPGYRRLVIEAALLLAVARLMVLLVPFRFLSRTLGLHMSQTEEQPLADDKDRQARRIAAAVTRTAKHVPWKAVCLPQAMAAKWMLRRRGFSSTLYLGVTKREASLEAHAWLRVGNQVVTGRCNLKRFAVVSTFA